MLAVLFFGAASGEYPTFWALPAIGYGASGSQLKSINWPKHLSYIEEQAFANTQFTELTLPSSVYYIADGSFAGCKKHQGYNAIWLMQIYAHAFHNCDRLTQFIAKVVPHQIYVLHESYDAPFYGIASRQHS